MRTPPLKAAQSPVTVASLNMQAIASSTAAALRSGRAHITSTSYYEQLNHTTTELTIEFSGDNRSTTGHQQSVEAKAAPGRDNGFDFANKVVDGRFFLLDAGHWIEDTNEHLAGSDLFSVDPRTFVGGAADGAQFKDVGGDTVDGVAVRHLTATKLDAVPRVNLGLGPVTDDQTKITKFDVWVDSANVVRRLDLATSLTETVHPLAQTILEKDAEGKVIGKRLDEANMGPAEERTVTNQYTVTFTDIGAPITIEAPANARKVAGQG